MHQRMHSRHKINVVVCFIRRPDYFNESSLLELEEYLISLMVASHVRQ